MMTERNAGLTLAEVRARQLNTHDQLLAFIDTVPESQFREETRFRRRLRWDTYGHYPRHAAAILAWRELRSVK
jgi:hypothetical protein